MGMTKLNIKRSELAVSIVTPELKSIRSMLFKLNLWEI